MINLSNKKDCVLNSVDYSVWESIIDSVHYSVHRCMTDCAWSGINDNLGGVAREAVREQIK